jgi:hypothetical protein
VLRLRKNGAKPPHPYFFMACCLIKDWDNFTFYPKAEINEITKKKEG